MIKHKCPDCGKQWRCNGKEGCIYESKHACLCDDCCSPVANKECKEIDWRIA